VAEKAQVSAPVPASAPAGFCRLQVVGLDALRGDAYVSYDSQRYLFVARDVGDVTVDVPVAAVPGLLKAGGFVLLS
jgi:hypothetical protein